MAEKLNVLLILTDQHRLSAVGAYGETVCRTPNIDRLAREGVRFENAYTVCPLCSPARASVMTGQFPHTHGVSANTHELGCSVHELRDRPELLSRRFEAAGYARGYSGKWHIGTRLTETFGGPNTPSLPTGVGFEGQDFQGHGGGGFWFDEYRQYLADNGFEHQVKVCEESRWGQPNIAELTGPIESTVPYFLAENTISMMDDFTRRGEPFFMWHNFWGPHEPYYATKEFLDLYRGVEIPPWPNYDWPSRQTPGFHQVKIHPEHENFEWEDWATAIRHYYASASMVDSQIGRILDHLARTGLLDKTVILFSADHGETLGSHGGMTDKGWHHFEETHRVPMILRLPDGTGAGEVREELVSLADIYPTVLDVAGDACRDLTLHGESLLPLAKGTATGWRDSVVVEFGGVSGSVATLRTLRHKNFKYGYNCGLRDELYDLQADPHETRNLINEPDYQDIAEDLRCRLSAWMEETQDQARIMFDINRSYDKRARRSPG